LILFPWKVLQLISSQSIFVGLPQSISADLFDTRIDHALADTSSGDELLVDGIDISSANRLADDTNANGLADGSSSHIIDISSMDRLTNWSLADDIDTSADQLADRSAYSIDTSNVMLRLT
jgi:hypothetical protein